ncbi:ribonuclease P protein component [Telmatospirillum sp. J64-1]|uniref:ribonuclease P protein component n=1 Tax=Telmatospirillum sp. J64-1 TaxID=2502183 RepID=UPI00115F030C|nr:ribonuclease P protein component [Telmatospirillum sp. J64-1]
MSLAVDRLKRRKDFLRVAAKRRKWAAPGLILQTAPADTAPPPGADVGVRLGFTCSRKVGNAVERNRARRRLKAAADLLMPRNAKPGQDYVLIGRQETLRRPFELLLQDLQTALKRLGAWRDAEGDASSSGRHAVSDGKPTPDEGATREGDRR